MFAIADRTLGEIFSMTTTALRSDATLRATFRIAMLGVGRWAVVVIEEISPKVRSAMANVL